MRLEPEKFPIDRRLEEIGHAFKRRSSLVVKAETGAGKTTRLPPYLLGQTEGKVLVLEPRRLAAKLSAARCADILAEPVGRTVGHHIRFDKIAGEQTRLMFITEGLFLPYLRQDPDLSDYSAVVIDEFHERNIHTDLALALTKRLQAGPRPDLKLVVMSATLETQKLEEYLDDPAVFDVEGRTFPVENEYRPPRQQGGGRRRFSQTWDEAAKEAVEEILEDHRNPLNTLVFLPGMGEIRALENKLRPLLSKNIEIAPLHSSLPKEVQNKAFQGDERKVILSTNIAETSLTIPNVTGVVDLGTERRAGFAPWSGMPLLQLEKISRASAVQRAGRAGRTRPGVVYRVYDEADLGQRQTVTPPDVKRVELSHHLLDLLDLGIHPDQLDWFEEPDEKNVKTSLRLLEILGAVKDDKITELGRFLASIPLHPRMGAMLFGLSKELLGDALLGACILSEGMVFRKDAQFGEDDEAECDLSMQMDLVKSWRWKDSALCDFHGSLLDRKKGKRALDLYQALAPRLKAPSRPPKTKTDSRAMAKLLLKGFPDRIAGKRIAKAKGRKVQSYNFCLGRGGKISFKSALSAAPPAFVIVLDALEDPKANAAVGTTIQAAGKIPKEALLDKASFFYSEETETSFNEKKGLLNIARKIKYGKLTVESRTMPPALPKGDSLLRLTKENWPWPFESDWPLREHNRRVKLLDEAGIEHNCPLFEGEMFELLLQASIEEETTYTELVDTGLSGLICNQLAPQDEYILNQEAPKEIALSNGKSFKIHYQAERPFIQARIQDLYSVTEHPSIAQGKTGLSVKLLSPANRIAQVVQNLPGFWNTSWPEVKKELKARYPKHFWPENPATAEPVRVKR